MQFFEKLKQRQQHSLLCIGLDPDFEQMPEKWPQNEAGIYEFCRRIVDATSDFAAAFKPQMAYFSALGFERALYDLIAYIHAQYPHIPVILDGKRGDIADTAKQYAKEAFERFEADAATVNAYMGYDSLQPWLDYTDNGIFILCRTSNAGGADLQNLNANGKAIFEHVADLAQKSPTPCGLVVGATFTNEIERVRQIAPNLPFLMPGVGHQGANLEQALKKSVLNKENPAVLIHSSRAILYAGCDSKTFEEAARNKAQETFLAIQNTLKNI